VSTPDLALSVDEDDTAVPFTVSGLDDDAVATVFILGSNGGFTSFDSQRRGPDAEHRPHT